jgi:hypothetical protein
MNSKAARWVLAALTGLVLFLNFDTVVAATPANVARIEASSEAQILDATVQIHILVPTDGGAVIAEGLGTLVSQAGGTRIVTHNHWGTFTRDAQTAEFYNASGDLLVKTSGDEFRGLIRYQDKATLVLDTPKGLSDHRRPASLGDISSVKKGDVVLVAHQAPNAEGKVAVLEAVVDSSAAYKGLSVFVLRTGKSLAIITGDSGGGVWRDGQLIGNMWGRETITTTDWKAWDWRTFQPGRKQTEICYVAKLPENAR